MSTDGRLYLIDANVIIHAHALYYPLKRVPEFWEWLLFHAENNNIKLPSEILDEVQGGDKDEHAKWVHEKINKIFLQLNETIDLDILNRVLDEGYADDLTDVEIDKIGKDPFLVSYGLVSPASRIIVSNEQSSPKKQRANRKVPDVCNQFGLRCCNVYSMLRDLDFRTNWKETL